MERRSALTIACGAIASAIGGAVLAPVAALIGHPLLRRARADGGKLLPVIDLERLPDGVPVRATVTVAATRDAWARVEGAPLGAVWLVRSGGAVRAFSTSCPHAGCFVDRDERGGFACPCHGSHFDADGRRLDGPAPRAMDALDCTVEGGKVFVRWQRFRKATPDREPA